MQSNMALNFWLAYLDLWDAEFTSCAPALVLHSHEYQATAWCKLSKCSTNWAFKHHLLNTYYVLAVGQLADPMYLLRAYVFWGCTNLTKVTTFLFSASLCSPNSPQNTNLFHSFALMSTISFSWIFFKFKVICCWIWQICLSIDISAENNNNNK